MGQTTANTGLGALFNRLSGLGRAWGRNWRGGFAELSVAALIASAISVARGAAPALSAPAITTMERTPLSLSMPTLMLLREWSRPTGLLGGFAVYLGLGRAIALLGAAGRPGLVALALATLGTYRWYAGSTHRAAAAVLALGPLLVALRQAGTAPGAPSPDSRRLAHREAASTVAPVVAALGLVGLWLIDRWKRNRAPEPFGRRMFDLALTDSRMPDFALADQPPEVTPIEDFYIFSKNVEDPVPSLKTWQLQIVGEVEKPIVCDFTTLTGLPRIDQHTTLQCVGNPLGGPFLSNGLWSGPALGDLLVQARPLPTAAWAICRSFDGLHEDLPLEVAMSPDTIVAYALNGHLLDRRHGYPARLVVPGRYGFKNVKWLQSIELVADNSKGYWATRGWAGEGIMQTVARIDIVRRQGNGVLAAGVAMAGTRGIKTVEARVVGADSAGDWHPAELHAPPLGRSVWVQWRVVLPAPPTGGGRVEARAVDGLGQPQVAERHGAFPAGATGIHSREIPE